MDPIETTPEYQPISFTKEITKSFVLSTVITAGMATGFLAVGLAMNKIDELKKSRAAKKDLQ